MLRLAADENLNADILRGLRRRNSKIDIVRIQDVGLSGADDSAVLQWASSQGRALVTHDLKTIPGFAFERVREGYSMSGVFLVPAGIAIGRAIEDILLLAECSLEGEWEGRVLYLPL